MRRPTPLLLALVAAASLLWPACSANDAVPPADGGPDVTAAGAANGGAPGTAGRDASGPTLDASVNGGRPSDGPDAAKDGSAEGGTSGHADGAPDGQADASVARQRRYDWQVFYDRSFAAHVEVDSKGAAVVSGTFFDTKDIHLGKTTLVSHGAADIMLSRILQDGTVDWARGYGALAEDYPVSFVLDPADRIDLVGLYNGTGNVGGPAFPTFAGTPNRYDVYVAGLEANGDHRWSHAITSTEEAFAGPGLALDDGGSLLVPGAFLGSATVAGAAHASKGSWDAFFARYDEPDGNVSADLPFGGVSDDRASQVVFTGADLLVLGRFSESVTFPTAPPKTLTSAGGTDVFIARLTRAGAMIDVVGIGGPGDEDVARARLDAGGNLIIGGTFSSPTLAIRGGPPLFSAGGRDLFVAALTPSLEHAWSVRYGGDGDDFLRDLALGPSDMVAITGEFPSSINFGTQTWTASGAADGAPAAIDFFVATLGGQGVPTWSFAGGGPLPDRGLGVAVDTSGGVYVTASFQSAIDFGGGKVLTPDAGQWASALVRYSTD